MSIFGQSYMYFFVGIIHEYFWSVLYECVLWSIVYVLGLYCHYVDLL